MRQRLGSFQCPECGALWNPSEHELKKRLNLLKARFARLCRERENFVNEHHDDNSKEFKLTHTKMKTDIAITEHALRCVREEIKGQPVQIWQVRYAKALEVAESMMSPEKFLAYKEALDKACRPKGSP